MHKAINDASSQEDCSNMAVTLVSPMVGAAQRLKTQWSHCGVGWMNLGCSEDKRDSYLMLERTQRKFLHGESETFEIGRKQRGIQF